MNPLSHDLDKSMSEAILQKSQIDLARLASELEDQVCLVYFSLLVALLLL
jgi:hypothetical protein